MKRKIAGWVLVAFGVIGALAELDDVVSGRRNEHGPLFGFGFASVFLVGGGLLVWSGVRAGRPAPVDATRSVLDAAARRGGRVTPVEVALDTGLEVGRAREILDGLAKKDACQILIGDSGILVYRFPELEDTRAKERIEA